MSNRTLVVSFGTDLRHVWDSFEVWPGHIACGGGEVRVQRLSRLVQIPEQSQVHTVCAHVADLKYRVFEELPFHIQIPLFNISSRIVEEGSTSSPAGIGDSWEGQLARRVRRIGKAGQKAQRRRGCRCGQLDTLRA